MRKYRKQRTVFESSQLKTLEDTFAVNAYPSSEEYETLSEKTSIDEARLRIWFQNRRARYRRSAKNSPSPVGQSPTSTLPAMPFHLPHYATSPTMPRLNNLSHSQLMMYGAHPFLLNGF